MSVIRYPLESAYTHPQFLWNEQETIIRLLNQNACKIGLREVGSNVTVSLDITTSMNTLAHGPADYPNNMPAGTFSTIQVRWIYFNANSAEFYIENTRPEYNQYLHGWYHPGVNRTRDRAVVFIDAELPAGQRCIVLDSPNSMYEYDVRIPLFGGTLHPASNPAIGTQQIITLPAGSYRFELRGARGGNGGNGGAQNSPNPARGLAGGNGGDGEARIFRIKLLTPLSGFVLRGGDGSNGANGGSASGWTRHDFGIHDGYNVCGGGGGGSSGQDSVIRLGNLSFIARGGGGGGGGGAVVTGLSGSLQFAFISMGAAGGGGGGHFSGAAGEGIPSGTRAAASSAGGGHLNNGGARGSGVPTDLMSSIPGAVGAGNIQNNDPLGIFFRRGADGIGQTGSQGRVVNPAPGGSTVLSTSAISYLRIFHFN